MSELKPCPFCGGKAKSRITTHSEYIMFKVCCVSCGAAQTKPLFDKPGITDFRLFQDEVSEKIMGVTNAWNRRAKEYD